MDRGRLGVLTMAATKWLDYNLEQNAFEPRSHQDALGEARAWHAAAVRSGGKDVHGLYQADAQGNIFEMETGDDDDGVAISLTAVTKKFDLGSVAMLHDCYLRLAAVTDTATLLVRVGGSEYGDLERSYSDLDLSGDGDTEIRVRLHRHLMGRWAQLELTGDFVNRPEIRDWRLRFIGVRQGRVSE